MFIPGWRFLPVLAGLLQLPALTPYPPKGEIGADSFIMTKYEWFVILSVVKDLYEYNLGKEILTSANAMAFPISSELNWLFYFKNPPLV